MIMVEWLRARNNFKMKTYKNLYDELCSINNLANAWRKARKSKTKKPYVIEFEKKIRSNLLKLREELLNQNYTPKPLTRFVIRDPKTRNISKASFVDRIVHHALIRVLEPIYEKRFICDTCANRKNKGSLFAMQRLDKFKRKVSINNTRRYFVLKADIKHYFEEINHRILITILKRNIKDARVINLVELILKNGPKSKRIGMPLGNYTSQFFANVYLSELDYFVKHCLKAKYYIRYVDDFIILHRSEEQLELWKEQIDIFLVRNLEIALHKDKSKILPMYKGIKFLGFRVFYYHKLLRKSNILQMRKNLDFWIRLYNRKGLSYDKLIERVDGWLAYASQGNTYRLRCKIFKKVDEIA